MSTVQILYTVKHLITKLRLWHWWVCFRRRRLSAYECTRRKEDKTLITMYLSSDQKEENVSFWKATSLLQAWFVGLFVALRPSTYLAFMMWKEKLSGTTQIKTHCHFHVPQTTITNRKYSQWKQPRNSFYAQTRRRWFFFFVILLYRSHHVDSARHSRVQQQTSRADKTNVKQINKALKRAAGICTALTFKILWFGNDNSCCSEDEK